MTEYPKNLRDFIGYGPNPPHPHWPNDAKIAIQFVLNYEEGAENCILDGDTGSETFLSEIYPAESFTNRHMSMESLYEYGSRAGVWRVLRVFERRGLPLTIFAVAQAFQRNPLVAKYCIDAGHEIASHGLRWKSYQYTDRKTEQEHMLLATQILSEIIGYHPYGWYTGRDSPHTRELLAEQGGYLYNSDSYADDLPYWVLVGPRKTPQLIIPYTLDTNDMKFASGAGFPSGEQFFCHLKDAFDVLYSEGEAGHPKMLNIGLHCRIVGRPARTAALERFLDYVQSHENIWITRRVDIARHWIATYPLE